MCQISMRSSGLDEVAIRNECSDDYKGCHVWGPFEACKQFTQVCVDDDTNPKGFRYTVQNQIMN